MATYRRCDICKCDMIEKFSGEKLEHPYYTVIVSVKSIYKGAGDKDTPATADICKNCVLKLMQGQNPVNPTRSSLGSRRGGEGIDYVTESNGERYAIDKAVK